MLSIGSWKIKNHAGQLARCAELTEDATGHATSDVTRGEQVLDESGPGQEERRPMRALFEAVRARNKLEIELRSELDNTRVNRRSGTKRSSEVRGTRVSADAIEAEIRVVKEVEELEAKLDPC